MLSPAPSPRRAPTATTLRTRADEAVITQWLLDQSTTPVRRPRAERPGRERKPRAAEPQPRALAMCG